VAAVAGAALRPRGDAVACAGAGAGTAAEAGVGGLIQRRAGGPGVGDGLVDRVQQQICICFGVTGAGVVPAAAGLSDSRLLLEGRPSGCCCGGSIRGAGAGSRAGPRLQEVEAGG